MIWRKYPEQKPNHAEDVLIQCLTHPLRTDDDGFVILPSDFDFLYLRYFDHFDITYFSTFEWEDEGLYAWLIPMDEFHEPTWVKFEDKYAVAWMRIPNMVSLTEEEAEARYEKYFKKDDERLKNEAQ